jgi:hypothetical protein
MLHRTRTSSLSRWPVGPPALHVRQNGTSLDCVNLVLGKAPHLIGDRRTFPSAPSGLHQRNAHCFSLVAPFANQSGERLFGGLV